MKTIPSFFKLRLTFLVIGCFAVCFIVGLAKRLLL